MTTASNDLAADLLADLERPARSLPVASRGIVEVLVRIHLREWHAPRIRRSDGRTLVHYGPIDVEF